MSPQRMSCINLYLEDGSERRDSDSGADEDGVLGAEDVGGGRAEGAVHVDLQWRLQLGSLAGPACDKNTWLGLIMDNS